MSFAHLPVPVIADNGEIRGHELSEKQEKMRLDVLAYFSDKDYKLPKEENGPLMDEEKMWLVSRTQFTT